MKAKNPNAVCHCRTCGHASRPTRRAGSFLVELLAWIGAAPFAALHSPWILAAPALLSLARWIALSLARPRCRACGSLDIISAGAHRRALAARFLEYKRLNPQAPPMD